MEIFFEYNTWSLSQLLAAHDLPFCLAKIVKFFENWNLLIAFEEWEKSHLSFHNRLEDFETCEKKEIIYVKTQLNTFLFKESK